MSAGESESGARVASAERTAGDAADLVARLRGLGFGGQALTVEVNPPLSRTEIREARTVDARRRWSTSPGFTRKEASLGPDGPDAEARWSLTPEALALSIGRLAPARARVVDGTCGAGGNTIGFARAGASVHALDLDAGRLGLAAHNVRVYRVAERCRLERADLRQRLPELTGDLLFLDPPWGADWNRVRTTLDELPLLGELLPKARHFPELWLKLPPSFDPASLPPDWELRDVRALFGVGEGDRQRVKLLLLRARPRR